jgi:hypothetical protein
MRDKHNRLVKLKDLIKAPDGQLYQVISDGPVPVIWDLGRTPKETKIDVSWCDKGNYIRWTPKDMLA